MTKEELKATIENKNKAIAECIEICKKYGVNFERNYEYTNDYDGFSYTLDFVLETETEVSMLDCLEKEEEFNGLVTDVSMLNDITVPFMFGHKFTLSEVESFELLGHNRISIVSNALQDDYKEKLGVEERTYYLDYVLDAIKNK